MSFFVRRKFFIVALLTLAAAGFASDAGLFFINISSSAPRGLYIAAAGQACTDDFVVYDSGRRPRLLKKVVAVADDEYIVTRDAVLVAGKEYRRQDDLPAQPGQGRYIIPADHFWLAGQCENSFDSRYLGPVSREKCQKVQLILRF